MTRQRRIPPRGARAALAAALTVLALCLFLAGRAPTSAVVEARSSRDTAAPGTSATRAPTPHRLGAVAERVAGAIRQEVPEARVGLKVYDRGDDRVIARLNAREQFAAMSVVKLLIALDVLAPHQGEPPDPHTRHLLMRMLSRSNDTIAGMLWGAGGQGAIVRHKARLLGLSATEPPDDPGEWGSTMTSPQDIVTIYRHILTGVPPADRELLIGALADATRISADGTYQYFGIPDALPQQRWAIKQGWGSNGPSAVYATTGLVGPRFQYIVVVLVQAPLGYYDDLPDALTAGTRQLVDLLR